MTKASDPQEAGRLWMDIEPFVPGIGVRWNQPEIRSVASFVDLISPLLSKWAADGAVTVAQASVVKGEVSWGRGLRITFDPNDIFVSFQYNLQRLDEDVTSFRIRPVEEVQPFTKLLDRVAEAWGVLGRLLITSSRQVQRVGVIGTGKVARLALAPGLEDYLARMKGPDGSEPLSCVMRVLAPTTAPQDRWSDRCHHNMSFDTTQSNLLDVSLDWQRIFQPPMSMDLDGTIAAISNASKEALAYFRRIGMGDLDEQ